MAERKVGIVENFFAKISVAAIKLTEGGISTGETIHVRGHSTDFEQKVESMQIEHAQVESADRGATIGMRMTDRVRAGDEVFIVTPD